MYSRKGWIHLCGEEGKRREGEVGRRRGRLIENPGGYHNGHSKQFTKFIFKQIYLD